MGTREGQDAIRNDGPFAWSDTPTPGRDLSDLAFGFCALFVATLVGLGFDALGLGTCVIIVYVVAVQVTALVTIRRLHCLLGSALSVALYNYFFTSPRHSLTAVGAAYPGTFAVMFVTALISSYAAMALRREVHRSHEARRRSSVMLETNRLLQGCADRGAIVNTAGAQLARMAHHACVWYQAQEDGSMAATSAYLPSGEKGLAQEFAPALPPLLDGSAYVGTPLGHEVAPELSRGVYLTVYDKAAEPADAGASQGGAPSEPVVAGVLAIDVDEAALGHDEANIAASIAGEASLPSRAAPLLEQREAAVTAKNEQLRANLLRSISHDLRTPLTAIAGNADVLLSDAAVLTEGQRAKLAADIRSDATWLTSTVENPLAITKLENGGMSLNATDELMDDIIEEALRHVDPAVSEHSLVVEPSPDAALVSVDARLMVQVVVNLVNNAVAHTPAGSRIAIRTWVEGARVRCSVADDGPGIPEADRARIFESFYTVNHGLADGHRSVGSNLSLCSSIMAAHGGAIGVSAVWNRTAAALSSTFPPAASRREKPLDSIATEGASRPTLLVVEDDAGVRNLIATTLEAHGYRHVCAATGRAAIAAATSQAPDIVLLDLGLPDMDGVEVVKSVRSWSQMSIIVVSARTEDADKIRALDAGADDYLTKPFSVGELLARIRTTLRRLSHQAAEGPAPAPAFDNGELHVDFAAGTASLAGRELHLTPMECRSGLRPGNAGRGAHPPVHPARGLGHHQQERPGLPARHHGNAPQEDRGGPGPPPLHPDTRGRGYRTLRV